MLNDCSGVGVEGLSVARCCRWSADTREAAELAASGRPTFSPSLAVALNHTGPTELRAEDSAALYGGHALQPSTSVNVGLHVQRVDLEET